MDCKTSLWRHILEHTENASHKPKACINMPKAMRAKERGPASDPQCARSVFGQVYRQLHFLPPMQVKV